MASTLSSAVPQVEPSIAASMGANLDADDRRAAVIFEPLLTTYFNEKQSVALYGVIERPTEPSMDWAIPKAMLLYRNSFTWLKGTDTAWRVYTTAIDANRMGSDGYKIRFGGAIEMERELVPNLVLGLRAGPYVQANEYTQGTNGVDLPRYGFSERLSLAYGIGLLHFEVVVAIDQLYRGVWKNDFATTEQVALQAHPNLRLGVIHELLSSVVDDSTGFYRPVRLFDGRDSRISVFADVMF